MSTGARRHLASVDNALVPFLGDIEERLPLPKEKYFESLCESIVSQQLSVKVSDVLWSRLIALFPHEEITPKRLLELDPELIRKQGISYGKIGFMRDLSERIVERRLKLEKLDSLNDEEVVTALTEVKGIGRWTAEMFMMFTLARPDVFSMGDAGLKRAIKKLYKLKDEPTEKELLAISTKWSPHRTFACRILWKTLDNK